MTYEYLCEACGHQWEAEQSIKDRPLRKCVSCSKNNAKRLISGGTGFLLKGGGWYADGYGSASTSKPASSAEKTDTKPSTTEAASKPATTGGTDSGGSGSTSTPASPAPTPASTGTPSAKAS